MFFFFLLVGHPNAKLLLYQSGVNGLYEALYHEVPIIAIPFAWDQPDVASRIVGRKIGLTLDFWSMTPEKIVSSITTVINDTRLVFYLSYTHCHFPTATSIVKHVVPKTF